MGELGYERGKDAYDKKEPAEVAPNQCVLGRLNTVEENLEIMEKNFGCEFNHINQALNEIRKLIDNINSTLFGR